MRSFSTLYSSTLIVVDGPLPISFGSPKCTHFPEQFPANCVRDLLYRPSSVVRRGENSESGSLSRITGRATLLLLLLRPFAELNASWKSAHA